MKALYKLFQFLIGFFCAGQVFGAPLPKELKNYLIANQQSGVVEIFESIPVSDPEAFAIKMAQSGATLFNASH